LPPGRTGGFEVQRFNQCRREFPKRCIPVNGQDQRIFIGRLGNGPGFSPGLQQDIPTHRFVDCGDRISIIVNSHR
jgi:hypothetical protein